MGLVPIPDPYFVDAISDLWDDDPAFAALVNGLDVMYDIYIIPGNGPIPGKSPGSMIGGNHGQLMVIDVNMINQASYHTFQDPISCGGPSDPIVTFKQVVFHELLHLYYKEESVVIIMENEILQSGDPYHQPRDFQIWSPPLFRSGAPLFSRSGAPLSPTADR